MANVSNPIIIASGDENLKLRQLINNTLEEVTADDIGQDATKIFSYTFYNKTALKKVTLPKTITEIENDAFFNCSGLEEINFPNSLTKLGNYAFQNCSKLEIDLDLTNTNITSIGTRTLHTTGIKSFIMPNNNCILSGDALPQCKNLKYIYFYKNNKIGSGYMVTGCNKDCVIQFEEGFNFTNIDGFCNNAAIKKIILPSSVTNVYSFFRGGTITNIVLGAETPPAIASADHLTKVSRIFVPTISAYETANIWSTKLGNYYPLVDSLSSVNPTIHDYACLKPDYKIYQYVDGQWTEI